MLHHILIFFLTPQDTGTLLIVINRKTELTMEILFYDTNKNEVSRNAY